MLIYISCSKRHSSASGLLTDSMKNSTGSAGRLEVLEDWKCWKIGRNVGDSADTDFKEYVYLIY